MLRPDIRISMTVQPVGTRDVTWTVFHDVTQGSIVAIFRLYQKETRDLYETIACTVYKGKYYIDTQPDRLEISRGSVKTWTRFQCFFFIITNEGTEKDSWKTQVTSGIMGLKILAAGVRQHPTRSGTVQTDRLGQSAAIVELRSVWDILSVQLAKPVMLPRL